MKKKFSIILLVTVLLSGCWDERLNKNIVSVPMVAFDGEVGHLKGYYGLPGKQRNTTEYSYITVDGTSIEDLRQKVDLQVNEGIDLSKLSSILISDELAEKELYHLLDQYYRNARNRLNTYLLVTEGDPEPFIKFGEKMGDDVNNYYSELVQGFIHKSVFPNIDLQLACSYLMDEAIDLTLPYVKISSENGVPEVVGLALFDGQKFTGKTLNHVESLLLQVMKDKIGKYANVSYIDNEVPVSFRINRIKRMMKWEGTTITIDYRLKVGIMEYYENHLLDENRKKKLEKFIQEKMTSDMEKVVEILHESNTDALGIGRIARAFHPDVFKEKKWKEIYPTLTIIPKVQVEITDTGVLD
ncbi:Ger(x)C family spore germination protein [Psychrobacillus sp.]|uniref:Ger(x)C family spore germination protein n=1 Tax=Psychrobacillus sp. TaxID=1871623 RepID=UPI0028BD98FD|nr:Ger(x)C family spore germination protein [Psychrobacillus sp.]